MAFTYQTKSWSIQGEKELDDTRGKVISDYQNILEKEWISLLQEKYSVNIYQEVLYSLIK